MLTAYQAGLAKPPLEVHALSVLLSATRLSELLTPISQLLLIQSDSRFMSGLHLILRAMGQGLQQHLWEM